MQQKQILYDTYSESRIALGRRLHCRSDRPRRIIGPLLYSQRVHVAVVPGGTCRRHVEFPSATAPQGRLGRLVFRCVVLAGPSVARFSCGVSVPFAETDGESLFRPDFRIILGVNDKPKYFPSGGGAIRLVTGVVPADGMAQRTCGRGQSPISVAKQRL